MNPTIDVSRLPHSAMDHRSLIWWGNVVLLAIETTMFAILVASYLYVRVVDFQQWPPPQVNRHPPDYNPLPALGVPTANLLLIVLSCAPMFWVDRACLKRNLKAIRKGMVVCFLLGVAAIALRFYEFPALKFRWDENAYASITWSMLGMHLAHLITAACEVGLLGAWVFVKGLDDKHARDIRVTAVYWYWVAGIWVCLYGLVFWGPRVF